MDRDLVMRLLPSPHHTFFFYCAVLLLIGVVVLSAAFPVFWWARWQAWPVAKVRLAASKKALGVLPTGSMGLPFWGESLDFLRSWTLDPLNPDAWYDQRHRRHGPVFRTYLFGEPTVVLLSADANKLVLCNEGRLFQNSWHASLRQLEGDNAVSMVHGDLHTRLRRALNVFLGTAPLREFLPVVDHAILSCLHKDWFPYLGGDSEILAYPLLQKITFQLNAGLFMGLLPGALLDDLHSHYHDFTAGLESFPLDLPWTVFGRAKRARSVLLAHIYSFIRERRRQLEILSKDQRESSSRPPPHLLDLLLLHRDEGSGEPYSLEEIGDNMLLLVHAGQDTIAGALAVILMNLARSPDALARLKAECRATEARVRERGEEVVISREELKSMEWLRCVIQEGLRICPPVSGLFKRAMSDVVFQGFLIPKGWKVHIVPRHTQRKAAYYPDPLTFDPSRFERRQGGFAYIPFGQGGRICPGMEFAMITMELFLYHLLCSVEDICLTHPHERIIVRTISPYPEHDLPLRLLPRIVS